MTALSLSPSLDMLATTHTDRRGIYLWSNQAVFGNPADFATHSEEVVDLALPTVSSGQDGKEQEEHEASSSGEEVGGGGTRGKGSRTGLGRRSRTGRSRSSTGSRTG